MCCSVLTCVRFPALNRLPFNIIFNYWYRLKSYGGGQGSSLATKLLQLFVCDVGRLGRVTANWRLPSLRERCLCEEIVLLQL